MENPRLTWKEMRAIAANANHKPAPYIAEDAPTAVPAVPTEAQLHAVSASLDALDVRATEFVMENRYKLRYVQSRGMWLHWDKTVWKWDTTGHAAELAKEFGRIFSYPQPNETDEQKSLRLKWYKILTTPKGISDLLSLAKTDPMLVASPEQFDAGVLELNTPAGVVNLRTGIISEPDPSRLVKRSTTVAPDASCSTDYYKNLLAEAFMGQPELSDYFEMMMGVTLLKGQQEQVFMYMFGKAGSGKGTLVNLAKQILGTGEPGYAANVDAGLFVSSRNSQHPTEMMQFLGARMVISSETTQGQRMDTGKLKRTTGGDSITGRYMNKDYVTFDPTHTLWLMANDRLQVPHDDQGVWRRLRVIPFNFAKKETEQASGLLERIYAEEAPGILARWISKASQYLAEGIYTPGTVLEAKDEYIRDQDSVQEWLDACCDTGNPSGFVAGEALRDSYIRWSRREGKTPLGLKKFAQDLNGKGFESDRKRLTELGPSGTTRQFRGFRGLLLTESVPLHV